jgi:surfeit locus 1 family protein
MSNVVARMRVPSRTVIAIAGGAVICGVAVALGNWQARRAEVQIALQRQWDEIERTPPVRIDTPAALDAVAAKLPVRVQLRGRAHHQRSIWLGNRILDGRPGYYVVTPVQVGASAVVLVNRGWVARAPGTSNTLPAVDQPEVLEIEGVALAGLPRLLELAAPRSEGPLPAVWQNLDLEAARSATGLPLASWVIQQTSDAQDGLQRRWPRPASRVSTHRGYAFQWYALAALSGVLTAYFGGRALLRDLRRAQS